MEEERSGLTSKYIHEGVQTQEDNEGRRLQPIVPQTQGTGFFFPHFSFDLRGVGARHRLDNKYYALFIMLHLLLIHLDCINHAIKVNNGKVMLKSSGGKKLQKQVKHHATLNLLK